MDIFASAISTLDVEQDFIPLRFPGRELPVPQAQGVDAISERTQSTVSEYKQIKFISLGMLRKSPIRDIHPDVVKEIATRIKSPPGGSRESGVLERVDIGESFHGDQQFCKQLL